MRTTTTPRAGALCCLAASTLFGLAACHSTPNDSGSNSDATAQGKPGAQLHASFGSTTQTVAYSEGADGFRVRQPGHEIVAEGPSAIALDALGRSLVLDRLAGRVVRVDDSGRLSPVATVPVDAIDLAAASDGNLVAFSAVRATAWMYEPGGARIGELKVPREVRELLHVELGPSRMLTLRTGYQERIDVGSPSAPLPLPVALATKREGSVQLADGRGVAVRVSGGQAELLVMNQAQGDEKASIERRFTLAAGDVSAARIVGLDGAIACMRVEHVTSSPTIAVDRQLVCMDAVSGNVTLDRALPEVGLYLPQRELVVGHGRVAMLHPEAGGVTIHRWTLDAEPRADKSAGEEVQP